MNSNNSYKKSRKSTKRRKRRGNATGVQRTGAMYNYIGHSGPIRSPPIAKELSVALRYFVFGESAVATAPLRQTFGLLEFLAQRPLYSSEFYRIYRYCKITAVDIHIEIFNKGINPIQVVLGYCPQSEAAAMTSTRLTEKSDTVRKIVSTAGGMDRAVLNKTFNVEQILGEPVLSKYWMDSSQSLSSSPIDVNEPVISFLVDYAGGSTTVSPITDIRITYHCQFFDLVTPAVS